MRAVLNKARFDLVEVAMMAGLTGFAVWATKPLYVIPTPSAEIQPFALRYGPSRESEHFEEWLIRDFFQDRRNGTFVDVGANHHRHFSNTWYLETSLGWSGIAVEPISQFAAGYAAERPRTKFRAFFVSDVSDETATMFVLDSNSLVSSQTKEFTQRFDDDIREVTVPTITLTDLLAKEGVSSIDFLTMDIELAEPQALAGFDIRRFKPALVCVEAHPEVRQRILDYFESNGYSLVGRYLRADEHNLYFAPSRVRGSA